MPDLIAGVADMLRETRRAERDLFGALDASVRETPIRPGDWTPKDFQAHLTAWKARQANRFAAARRGGEAHLTPDGETDEVNAKLREARLDWTWDAIVEEADTVSDQLLREVTTTTPDMLEQFENLLAGTFGNGPFHAMTHFAWLEDAGVPVDSGRIARFADTIEEGVRTTDLPARDAGTAIYNLACYHALAGRLDVARGQLREAFELRPDLADFSMADDDLIAIRGELPALAGRDDLG
ncbi:MAG TPA: hypothetical protein VFK61_06815 [Candidatus Limnocylindria bacterium]|nr:hypothetical protein [Candidatus Limnocylindria bacterium]